MMGQGFLDNIVFIHEGQCICHMYKILGFLFLHGFVKVVLQIQYFPTCVCHLRVYKYTLCVKVF